MNEYLMEYLCFHTSLLQVKSGYIISMKARKTCYTLKQIVYYALHSVNDAANVIKWLMSQEKHTFTHLLASKPTPLARDPTQAVFPFPSPKASSHSKYKTPTAIGDP